MIDAQAMTALAIVAGFAATWWKDARARKWALEDRKAELAEIVERAKAEATASRIHREATTENLRLEARQVASRLADQLKLDTRQAEGRQQEANQKTADILATKIDAVKLVAEGAFSEANSTHLKQQITNRQIADLNRRLFEQGAQAASRRDLRKNQLETLQGTTGEIKATVDRIDEKIVEGDN